MSTQLACPEPGVIRDLLHGELPESEFEGLSEHFDSCAACCQQFDAEASDPEFFTDVAQQCNDTNEIKATAIDRLMRDIPDQLSSAADPASVAEWSIDAVAEFLEPSENREHLGRLGAYEVVEVIGRGGMGVVLRGIHTQLNRVVAIKVLAPEYSSNPNARRRFFREAQAAAAVSHDHVVTIHAVHESERLPYLVMEFVAGESLDQCVRRAGALSLEQILWIGRQTALGLAAAHEVGLVHRDMKPVNILLENGIQRVRITDFGLARTVDDVAITQSGTVAGTPLYMSPEQASGDTVDHRSDLFSLGSVMYAMCTERPAFRAQSTIAVIRRVCDESPRAIREINPNIPSWLADIVDRMIAKRPDDSFQDAAEVAALLGEHLAHLQDPEHVPPPASVAVNNAAKPTSQPRRLLLLLALVVGLVTIGVTEASGFTNLREYLGVILRLETEEGTLVVQIEDPNVKVSVDGNEIVVDGVGVQELRLKPGKHQWTTKRNGTSSTQWVTIERGGKAIVRVQQLPPKNAKPKPTAPGSPGGLPIISPRAPETSPGLPGTPGAAPVIPHQPHYDGLVFPLPENISRLYSGQPFEGPDGLHKFAEVPSYLWGQRCATAIREGGRLMFNVKTYGRKPRRQRVWLLISRWDANTEKTREIGFAFDTRESLMEKGWKPSATLVSENIKTKQRQKWSVMYQDVDPNRGLVIHTHSTVTPMVVWGSVDMNGVVVDAQWDQHVETFKKGATVPLGNGHHVFNEIPGYLDGLLYTKRNGYQGITHFSVKYPQRVFVALYDWRHMYDGNSSGDWHRELVTKEDMTKLGWKEVAVLKANHSDSKQEGKNWHLYMRDCKGGDTFALRNHKYQAPIVFGSPERKRQTPMPIDIGAPATSSKPPQLTTPIVSGAKPKAKPNVIELPRQDAKTQVGPTYKESKILSAGGDLTELVDLHSLYVLLRDGRHRHPKVRPGGNDYLIGQINEPVSERNPLQNQGGDIEVSGFQRTGNRVTVKLRRSKTGEPTTQGFSAFFRIPIPPLPPGNYEVDASFENSDIHAKGTFRIVPSDPIGQELKSLAIEAIFSKPTLQKPDNVARNTQVAGIDLGMLLTRTAQMADLKSFPTELKLKRDYVSMLSEKRKIWALCALLNQRDMPTRMDALTALVKIGDHNIVPVLLALAKQKSHLGDPELVSAFLALAKEKRFFSEPFINLKKQQPLGDQLLFRFLLIRSLTELTGVKLIEDSLFKQIETKSKVKKGEILNINQNEELLNLVAKPISLKPIDEWLRTVYLADTQTQAAIPYPDDAVTGLMGRIVADAKDTGHIIHYPHATFFEHSELPESVLNSNSFSIALDGYIDVPQDMTVHLWQAGGGVSGDVNWLYVDGTEVCVTGDDRGKNFSGELHLLKGLHQVRWVLTGGTFRTNILAFVDPKNGKLLQMINKGQAVTRRADNDKLIEIKPGATGWPIRENWLPPIVDEVNPRNAKAKKEAAKKEEPAKAGF